MNFSPILVSSLLVTPLRYFFSTYTAKYGFIWNVDPKISTIEIGTVNDFNQVPVQKKPRILINRGSYIITKSGLSDSRLDGKDLFATGGLDNKTNSVWINGQASITVEGTNEGTIEMLLDMVSVFLVWARPLLSSSQGFHEMGLPMQVSECTISHEDIEKFTSTIMFPYSVEQQWNVWLDPIKFKSIVANIIAPNTTPQVSTTITSP